MNFNALTFLTSLLVVLLVGIAQSLPVSNDGRRENLVMITDAETFNGQQQLAATGQLIDEPTPLHPREKRHASKSGIFKYLLDHGMEHGDRFPETKKESAIVMPVLIRFG
ncbi:hypothetical protein BV898_05046 [Hypsibius exemplaris]|uniref:Uncharacterized protein n=1 Tax=Hypsibius exemplaris TaxID=2072580 RepID=A0A1W0X0H4_HYPEX|nr:hypothetical protein BV898_05046 [Hypsibius exemplaris]